MPCPPQCTASYAVLPRNFALIMTGNFWPEKEKGAPPAAQGTSGAHSSIFTITHMASVVFAYSEARSPMQHLGTFRPDRTLCTPWSWQKYCLNHCARACCSLRIVTRCRFTTGQSGTSEVAETCIFLASIWLAFACHVVLFWLWLPGAGDGQHR